MCINYGSIALLKTHILQSTATFRTVKTCEERSAVNHCAQMRLIFKRKEAQIWMKSASQNASLMIYCIGQECQSM